METAISKVSAAIQARQCPDLTQQTTSTSTLRGDDLNKTQRQAVNYFYGRVKAVYGSRYKSQFPSDDDERLSKSEWSGQVMNLDKENIDRGVEKLKGLLVAQSKDYEWVNIPLIAALCQPQPEDYGMPDIDKAWHEAEQNCHQVDKHQWSHEAVRLAGGQTGWLEIMGSVSEKRRQSLKTKFEQRYRYLVGREMDGKPLLESDSNKPAKSPVERSHDYHTQKQLHEMKAQGINPAGGYSEFKKRWVRLMDDSSGNGKGLGWALLGGLFFWGLIFVLMLAMAEA